MAGKPNPEYANTQIFSIRLPISLRKQLEEYAKTRNRKFSNLIWDILDSYLNNYEINNIMNKQEYFLEHLKRIEKKLDECLENKQ